MKIKTFEEFLEENKDNITVTRNYQDNLSKINNLDKSFKLTNMLPTPFSIDSDGYTIYPFEDNIKDDKDEIDLIYKQFLIDLNNI